MDVRGCLLVLIVVIHCVCVTFVTSSQEAEGFHEQQQQAAYSQLRGKGLEQKLREEIERELTDVRELERQLMGHLSLITEKKRQLEIKKRQPVRCLVDIVSCWKRK